MKTPGGERPVNVYRYGGEERAINKWRGGACKHPREKSKWGAYRDAAQLMQTTKAKRPSSGHFRQNNAIKRRPGVYKLSDVFEVTERLTLTRVEAVMALHALRNYADVKGDIGVNTSYLQNKLEAFIESGGQPR